MSEGIVFSLPGGATLTLPRDTPHHEVEHYLERAAPARQTAQRSSSPFLTVSEAADYLRFPKKRLYNLTSRGEVPHRKQGSRIIFRRDELDRWMDEFYEGPEWAGPGARADL